MTNDNSANNPVPNFYRASAADFKKIPGSPIAYWVSDKIRKIFEKSILLKSITYSDGKNVTGKNDIFLKNIWEIDINKVGKDKKWLFVAKGGEYRKWYGNIEYVINWSAEAREHYRKNKIGRIIPEYLWFKKGITWSKISSLYASFRILPEICTFDEVNITFNNEKDLPHVNLFLNSKVVKTLLKISNPTLSFQTENILNLPFLYDEIINTAKLTEIYDGNIDISREEWDSRETSWDFTTNELLHHKTTNKIEDAYNTYCAYWKNQFFKLHSNEEELNRIFIDIYDLADELTPDVPLNDITILKTEADIKDGELVFKKETLVKHFISYAVGCMFGRYSPDKEGLILANQGETIEDFREKVPDASFMPDDDNIIPILEDEYFTDDIVSRFKEFLKATFGAESLADNLEFIAGALSKSKKGGGSPEKVIRDYFLKSFFKDHVKMYKKRPIYWLFTSGKGRGFNALVYMHRYDRETLAKMRTDYLLELEAKLDARIGMLGDESAAEKGKLGKQVEELMDYDAVLNNKSLQMIDIDLDDGVKVNYAKFEGLVGKI